MDGTILTKMNTSIQDEGFRSRRLKKLSLWLGRNSSWTFCKFDYYDSDENINVNNFPIEKLAKLICFDLDLDGRNQTLRYGEK